MQRSSIEVNADSRVTIYAAAGCNWCHATEAMLRDQPQAVAQAITRAIAAEGDG